MQKRLTKIIIIIFCGMLTFSIISRINENYSVATVATSSPQHMKLSHGLSVEAQVVQGHSTPIFIEDNLYIDAIYCEVGQQITQNQKLLKLNKDKLDESIKQLHVDIEMLALQIAELEDEERYATEVHNQEIKNYKEQLKDVVDSNQKEIAIAKEAFDEAKKSYELFVNQNLEKENPDAYEEQLNSLYADMNSKEQVYYSALEKSETEIAEAEKTLSLAQISPVKSTTREQYAIQKEHLLEQLAVYKKYVQDDYAIRSEVDGVITEVFVEIGQATPATASFIVADTTQDYKIVITEDVMNEKYLYTGMEVEIVGQNKEREEVKVNGELFSSKIVQGETGQYLEGNIYIPSNIFELSSFVTVYLKNTSDYFDYCVPNSVINQDEKGQFVYVADKKETALGEEEIARKIYIKVEDQNAEYSAVEPGTLTTEMQIITETNKELTEGCKIRSE